MRMQVARIPFLTLVLLLACTQPSCVGRTVEIDSSGRQQQQEETQQQESRNVTFVNSRKRGGDVALYWCGNGQSSIGSGPRLFYGPLAPNGGSRVIEGFPGQNFVLVEVGTYRRLQEFTISHEQQQTFHVTDAHAAAETPPSLVSRNDKAAQACRSFGSCEDCMVAGSGCGWSVVRESCFLRHPIATTTLLEECHNSRSLPAPNSKSVDAWLNQANALLLLETANPPRALRKAYQILEHALSSDGGTERTDQHDALGQKKIKVALKELSAKLEAIFDDQDATELLEKSRHELLAQIHPEMPLVERKSLVDAKSFIAQGKPVVITDAFANEATTTKSPVSHKWTLEYLHRKIFGTTGSGNSNNVAPPKFNVAADREGQCCRYFEPQNKAKQSGYPYPFAPSTHLYRDKFDGFIKTVRKAARSSSLEGSSSSSNNNTTNKKKKARMLHYLHEIVMNEKGEAVVAGGTAPPALVEDLEAIKTTLQPIAEYEPFYGGFASAKLWMGQKGIIMPMHYDSTDNLYVMAWGRKRAIIGPPGQLDALYRYPNAHPLVGSSQVNLSAPDLQKFPRFRQAELFEVIVGPGDILYLPGWWWHQFEQPYEDTGALNLWSRDRERAPEPPLRDIRIREHALFDQLERSVTQLFGNRTGLVLDALANNNANDDDDQQQQKKDNNNNYDDRQLANANKALKAAAESWREWAQRMPGGHPKASQSAAQLVSEFLETIKEVMPIPLPPNWLPGTIWDLSRTAVLPRDLRDRCESAPETSPFMSYCG